MSLGSACARTIGSGPDAHACYSYEKSLLSHPPCASDSAPRVPLIYHASGAESTPPYAVRANAAANPEYKLQYQNDSSAGAYVSAKCGADVRNAYDCFEAPAYRADIFRFCALHAEGGVYLDADILLTAEMNRVYAPCASATLGHDFPWFGPAKQMKILAARPNATIFKCMLHSIVRHVAERKVDNSLALTGPALLERCYRADPARDAIALTYIDTRGGEWPYTGMRANNDILAYERPSRKNFGEQDEGDYARLAKEGHVYRPSCQIARLSAARDPVSPQHAPPPPAPRWQRSQHAHFPSVQWQRLAALQAWRKTHERARHFPSPQKGSPLPRAEKKKPLLG